MKAVSFSRVMLACCLALSLCHSASAQDDGSDDGGGGDLAKQLSNPVAALISVPLEFDTWSDIGPADDGERWTFIAKPVIPISLNEKWNLISRTIVGYIDQEDIFPDAGSQSGLSDTLQSVFFSPKKPTAGGWIWGAGPVLLLPTASDDLLGSDKWGIGPTAVALKQTGPWTYGALVNQVVSFAGNDGRSDINNTFLQPFLAYNTKNAVTLTLQTESTYSWEDKEWSVPINLILSKIVKVGPQLIQLRAGVRYWANPAPSGPEGWGGKLAIVLLFPK